MNHTLPPSPLLPLSSLSSPYSTHLTPSSSLIRLSQTNSHSEMASTSGSNNADLIQGLNLIHPPPTPTATSDADILSSGPYSDLSAQLDLWTNVHFASDEPFVAGRDPNNGSPTTQDEPQGGEKKTDGTGTGGEGGVKKKRDLVLAGKKAQSHLNQSVAQTHSRPSAAFTTMAATNNPPFDLSALFGGAPSGTAPNQFHPQAMNINQLLAMQAFPNPFQAAAAFSGTPFPAPAQVAFPPPSAPTTTTTTSKSEPSAKRSKTTSRKNSASTSIPAPRRSSTTAPSEAASRTERSQSPVGDDHMLDDGDENEQGQ